MSEENYTPEPSNSGNMLRNILLAVAALYVLISGYFLFDMHSRIGSMEEKQKVAETAQKDLQERFHQADMQTKAGMEALGSKVGMTQEELAKRTSELAKAQQSSYRKLSEQQQKQEQVVSQVTGEVAGVKTELGGAKTDIASTKTDLEATKAKLEKAIGDLGVQSGLIAKNHDELEILKHRGDRNYFEFTLTKKQKRQAVGTISLELKKTDPKKSKFTLNVLADDKTIEKKDRTANEPLQFYTMQNGARQLYELVVFTVGKDTVSGYLSTPKS